MIQKENKKFRKMFIVTEYAALTPPYRLYNLTLYSVVCFTTFTNSLDPAQAWQDVRPDLDPNRWTH